MFPIFSKLNLHFFPFFVVPESSRRSQGSWSYFQQPPSHITGEEIAGLLTYLLLWLFLFILSSLQYETSPPNHHLQNIFGPFSNHPNKQDLSWLEVHEIRLIFGCERCSMLFSSVSKFGWLKKHPFFKRGVCINRWVNFQGQFSTPNWLMEKLSSPKLTWLWKPTMKEAVFPIENCDFPMSC